MTESRYKQIALDLENKILANELKEGDKLSSERDLSIEYNVTRTTIRRAIEYLIDKGFLKRKTGSGTYIEKNHLYFNVQEQISFSEKMTRLDNDFKTEVIEFTLINASIFLKEIFSLKNKEKVFYAKRIRYINDIPVNIETTYIPQYLFPELTSEILKGSKYKYVEKIMNYKIKESINTLFPIISDEDISKIFSLEKGTPIFQKKTHGILITNQVFEYSELFFNPKYYEFTYTSYRS